MPKEWGIGLGESWAMRPARVATVSVRMSQADKEWAKLLAARYKVTLSDLVRYGIKLAEKELMSEGGSDGES